MTDRAADSFVFFQNAIFNLCAEERSYPGPIDYWREEINYCGQAIDYSKPYVVSAVGVYIAIASFYFVVVFSADVLNRYFQDKPWYPNRYISLNAISLTALSIAIKIPTDITTPMVQLHEQLPKLTGSSLACILIANTMPSLGDMEGKYTIMSNVGALVIVVVTLIVDLWIQIKTCIIKLFWMEQIIVMVIMLLQLLFVVSTVVAVPTTKELMERQFKTKHNQQSKVKLVDGENYMSKIKENLTKYWIMAHTSNPQFVVARSPTCIASDGLCLVTATVMIVTIMRIIVSSSLGNVSCIFSDNVTESAYHPTVLMTIVFIQISAIILGTIGPASRCMWWSDVVRVYTNWKESIKYIIKVEEYWVSSLEKWKGAPLLINSKQRWIRKVIRFFKRCVLTLLVKMQMLIVIVSKLIRAVSVVPMLPLQKILELILHLYFFLPATIGIVIYLKIIKHLQMLIYLSPYFFIFLMRAYLVRLMTKFQLDRLRIMDEHQRSINSDFVLHLEGETGLVRFITEDCLNNGRSDKKKKKEEEEEKEKQYSFNNGRSDKKKEEEEEEEKEKQKNAKLIQLIENHSTLKEGFHLVTAFRADTRSSFHPDLLRCSWALPLVTLSCIAVTLPDVDRNDVNLLLEGVNRGLKFVRLIEQSIDDSLLVNMRETAEIVWLGIDLDEKWLDFHLDTFSHSEVKDAREVVNKLKKEATKHVLNKFKNDARQDVWDRPYEWPPMVLAADCMHTVCTTILQNYDGNKTDLTLFQWLRRTIADILGACLTNLPEVIDMECSKKSIEVREEGVLNAKNLFIETKDILEILYADPVVASKLSERKKHIEEWQSRDAIVATDISGMEDLSLHPEPSSATTQQLEHVVIEVDTASEHTSGFQRM